MRRRTVFVVLGLLLLLPLLAVALLAWLLATESGARFSASLAGRVPGLSIESPRGRLMGPLSLDRLVYETADRRIIVEDLVVHWQPRRLRDGLLMVERLEAGHLRVLSRPSEQPRQAPPARLELPMAVQIERLRAERITFGSLDEPDDPPTLELHDLSGRFESDGSRHAVDSLEVRTARLAISGGSGSLGGVSPFPLNARAQLSGEERGHPFTVSLAAAGSLRFLAIDAQSRSGDLNVQGRAHLDIFDAQPLLHATISASGLDPAAWIEDAPQATLSVDASIMPMPGMGNDVSGEIAVTNATPGRIDQGRLPVRSVRSTLRHAEGKLVLPEFVATLSEGTLAGSATYADDRLTIDARASGVNMAALHQALHKTSLGGEIEAAIGAAGQRLRAQLADRRFRLTLDATREGELIRLDTARLAAGTAVLDVSGRLDPRGPYNVQGRLQDFDPSAYYAAFPRSRLNARLQAQGTLGQSPTAQLQFVLDESLIAGRQAVGRGELSLQAQRLEQVEVTLRAGDNRLDARGRLGQPGDVLHVEVSAPRLDQIGMPGQLAGKLTLTGEMDAPGAEWTIEAPRLVLPNGYEIRSLSSRGRMEPDFASVQAELTAERMLATGDTPPLSDISARIEGQRELHQVQAQAQVGDGHRLDVAAAGGLDAGRVWTGRIRRFEWSGPHPARLVAPAELRLGAGRILLERAHLSGSGWNAAIDRLRWEPDILESRGRFSGLHATTYVDQLSPESDLRLGGEWDVAFGERLSGSARVFRETGDVVLAGEEAIALGLERLLLTARFTGQRAQLDLDAAGSRAGIVRGSLSAPMRREGAWWTVARQAPWQGRFTLEAPSIAWVGPLLGDNVAVSGRMQGEIELTGTPAAPETRGQLQGDALKVALLQHGLELGGGALRLELTPETARLHRLEFISVVSQRPHERRIDYNRLAAQPGRLIAEGEIGLKNGAGQFTLRAEQLAVSQLPDRWMMVSGEGALEFTEARLGVKGNIAVDAAYWELTPAGMPTLSEDVVVLGREEQRRASPRLNLDLVVNLGRHFYFRGAGIESRLAGELRLAAERRDQLRASGFVRTVGGTFDAYGRELSIDRGILNFQGLIENPGLNVRAVRKRLPVEAGVEVSGTLKDPRVTLVSEPDVPDTEKLSWMVLGRPPSESLSSQDADLLLSAAMALRGSQSGKGPLQSLMQNLGLEELGISSGSLSESRRATTHVAGTTGFGSGSVTANEQIATVGKRIGTNAVLSYERSLTTAESILKLTVDLTRRISVVGRVGADNAVDLLYTFSFGGRRRSEDAAVANRDR